MKVIGGHYKGTKLACLKNSNHLRPTSSIVKESIFNVLRHRYEKLFLRGAFLDAFAGTGAVALEALSRGSPTITLVEKERTHAALIEKNLDNFSYDLIRADFFKTGPQHYKNGSKFSSVFLDPPYKANYLQKSIIHLVNLKILTPQAIIICESLKGTFNPEQVPLLKELGLKVNLTKTFGSKELHFLLYHKV